MYLRLNSHERIPHTSILCCNCRWGPYWAKAAKQFQRSGRMLVAASGSFSRGMGLHLLCNLIRMHSLCRSALYCFYHIPEHILVQGIWADPSSALLRFRLQHQLACATPAECSLEFSIRLQQYSFLHLDGWTFLDRADSSFIRRSCTATLRQPMCFTLHSLHVVFAWCCAP